MHLNSPNRPVAFKPRKEAQRLAVAPRPTGWSPFQSRLGAHEYDLVPYANTHPIKALYPEDEELAVFARLKHRKDNPLIDAVIASEHAKAQSAAKLSEYIAWRAMNPKNDNNAIKDETVQASTEAIQAYTNMINTCIETFKRSPDNMPVELNRLDKVRRVLGRTIREDCTITYRTFAVAPGTDNAIPSRPCLQNQSSGTVTWHCPFPWLLPSHIFHNVQSEGTSESIRSIATTIYTLIDETLPHIPETSRARTLIARALDEQTLDDLRPQPVETGLGAGISEPSVLTMQPQCALNADGYNQSDGSIEARHTFLLGAQSVNVCADWHNPKVNQLLKTTILKSVAGRAHSKTTNLFSLSIRILAPVLDANRAQQSPAHRGNPHTHFHSEQYLAEQWECHVFDIMPFAGADTCTVTTLYYEQDGVSDQPAGFVILPPHPVDNEGLEESLREFSDMHVKACIGAQRNMRYNDLQIAKLLAEGCTRYWYTGNISNFAKRMQYQPREMNHVSFAARISSDNWDFALCSHYEKDASKVHTIITAVHYPPRITHAASRGVIPQSMKASSNFFIHLAAADLYDVHLEDDREDWVYYYAKSHGRHVDTQGLQYLHFILTDVKSKMALAGWGEQKLPFFDHIVHFNLHQGSTRAEIEQSLRAVWILQWRHVIRDAVTAMYNTHKVGVQAQHINPFYKDLLTHGVFQLNTENEAESLKRWMRILDDDSMARWYMTYLNDYYRQNSGHAQGPPRPPAPALPWHSAQHDDNPGFDPDEAQDSTGEGQDDDFYNDETNINIFQEGLLDASKNRFLSMEVDEDEPVFDHDMDYSDVTFDKDVTEQIQRRMTRITLTPNANARYLIIRLRNHAGQYEYVGLCDFSKNHGKIKDVLSLAHKLWEESPNSSDDPTQTDARKDPSGSREIDELHKFPHRPVHSHAYSHVKITREQQRGIEELRTFAQNARNDLRLKHVGEPYPEHPEYELRPDVYERMKADEPRLLQFIHDNQDAIIKTMIERPAFFRNIGFIYSHRFKHFAKAIQRCKELAFHERMPRDPVVPPKRYKGTSKVFQRSLPVYEQYWSSRFALMLGEDIHQQMHSETTEHFWFLQFKRTLKHNPTKIKSECVSRWTKILTLALPSHTIITPTELLRYVTPTLSKQFEKRILFFGTLPAGTIDLNPQLIPPKHLLAFEKSHPSKLSAFIPPTNKRQHGHPRTATILNPWRTTAAPPALATKLSRLEQKLESTERMGNMKHLLGRLLTRLEHATGQETA